MNGVHFLFSNMELFAIIEVQDLDRKDEFLLEEKMGRRERKKMQSRQAILEAAISEFSKKGYKETSVADIMSAADFGIGTFYNYFSSKEELLFSLLSRLGETIRTRLRERHANRRSGRSDRGDVPLAVPGGGVQPPRPHVPGEYRAQDAPASRRDPQAQ